MSFTSASSVPHLVATSSSNELVGSIEDDVVASVNDISGPEEHDDDDDEALNRTLDLQVAVAISSQELSLSQGNHSDEEDKEDDAASTAAVQAAFGEEPPIEEPWVCRICGKLDERPMVRFRGVEHDMSLLAAAPSVDTFSQDIALHVFCGKTASILPNVNRPDLEILTKAGLKNKHGIGPEVNAALARTRSSTVNSLQDQQSQQQQPPKQFYLVREFEAHLTAIRHSTSTRASAAAYQYEEPRPKRSKIRCECGGTYTMCRYQIHCRSKKHQQWMADNGMYGTTEEMSVVL